MNIYNYYPNKDCKKCTSLEPNLTPNQNTSFNQNNISRKMRLAQRIRSRGKLNANSKSSSKIHIYNILFNQDYYEIRRLLFKIGKRQMDFYVNSLSCSQTDKNITSSILEIYNVILSNLTINEQNIINNICP